MTAQWWAILVLAAGSYALKALGYFLPDRVFDHPRVARAASVVPVALLTALTVVQVFGDGQALVIDARVVGIAFAVLALLLRAPFLVVVVGAGAVTAAARALAG